MTLKTGFVGWRGMVGSVLMQRMQAEGDFAALEPVFFSTSNAGGRAPLGSAPLADANDFDALAAMEAIVSCQGGDYTKAVHARLREGGWNGYWIDAASALRMAPESTIVLDPVNRALIDRALADGKRDFIGGNCTVSLMILALHGLLRDDLVQWATATTYQAASGAGAQAMRELVQQMGALNLVASDLLADESSAILDIDAAITDGLRSPSLPTTQIGAPLAGSLLPWIDTDLGNGTSREEWKGEAELNRILGRAASRQIPIESLCVRVGTMRCHSQAVTLKLSQDLPLDRVERLIAEANPWIRYVANRREPSLRELTPTAVSGSLGIAVGRLRKLHLEPATYSLFTVGDQLLWGAAEPLRRILAIIVGRL